MNSINLFIYKLISEFCINRNKWKSYHFILKIVNVCSLNKNKYLDTNKCAEIFNKIDNHLNHLNLGNKCLIRSCMALLVLKAYKNNYLLNLGVKLNPFEAHAWITENDIPIFEKSDTDSYKVFKAFNYK